MMGTKYEAPENRAADIRFINLWMAIFQESRARVIAAMPARREKIGEVVK